MELIMDKVVLDKHSVRVEIVPNELLGIEIKEPQDYFNKWLKGCLGEEDKYNAMSEKKKKAYQKKYFETERILWEEFAGQIVARYKLTLNTDWTWNVLDLKTNIEYKHCYPVSETDDLSEPLREDNFILYLPATTIKDNYLTVQK
jgi:hypothetical protein